MNERNKIRFKGGYATNDPLFYQQQDAGYRESTRGSIVLSGVVDAYNGTTQEAFVDHRSGETVKAYNRSGFSLIAGDKVMYMLDDGGEYTIIGVEP